MHAPLKHYILLLMSHEKMRRKDYIDFLRIFAIFLVLFNHTTAFHLPFNVIMEQYRTLPLLFVSICDKVAVPIFFMISGALLLPKQESLKELFKHRVFRFLLVIGLFHIVQLSYALIYYDVPFSTKAILHNCIMGTPYPHESAAIWFLYAYLAYLLLLPFLRAMVSEMTNEHFIYLFILQMSMAAFIPLQETGLLKYLYLCSTWSIYPLAGYFIEHRIHSTQVSSATLFRLGILSFGCLLLGTLMCTVHLHFSHNTVYSQKVLCFKGCILIPCLWIYLTAKHCSALHSSGKGAKTVSMLGQATFTIMLLENILRDFATRIIPPFPPGGYCMYARDICVCILACAIGFIIGIILKKIPGLRSLL